MSKRTLPHAPLAALLAACAFGAQAAPEVSDPLRPPALARQAEPAAAPAAAALRLQATRIGRDDRYAVIDGITVRRGERIGDLTVVRIDAAEVTVRDDQDVDRVLRFDAPGLNKRPVGRTGKPQ
ncbi:hypothetical protein E6C76_13380 [Pseudothauera nasutitermitis]|uniref:MSHA biogenesis protein MshK n=1 Tax=Pseudothauera nasutitermitis TaxID=2565930 RepID=A0A4S4AUU9_9RHOO|nr:hypothetical protein [Pseudothauera nasutitermitis]THF63584.1 hypothetical protein E6C76_13380 [Pseudothauera nasutitermitis]